MIRLFQGLSVFIDGIYENIGRFFIILWASITWGLRPPYDVKEWFRQMVRVGVDSIPVVFLTALFTGMVLALETFEGFQRFHAENYVGSVVSLSMLRELSPVLAALMVTGRVGSAMAAEIGTMRVTEQIDALVSLATNPIQYLIFPRVLAATLMMPLLTIMGDAVGIIGGYMVTVNMMGANPVIYMESTFQFLEMGDLTNGIIKAGFFGLILAVTGCMKGFYTTGGAEGVGEATTQSVVMGSLVILLTDFFLTKLLF